MLLLSLSCYLCKDCPADQGNSHRGLKQQDSTLLLNSRRKLIHFNTLVVQLLKAATAKKDKNKANPLSPCLNTKYSQQENIQLLQPE